MDLNEIKIKDNGTRAKYLYICSLRDLYKYNTIDPSSHLRLLRINEIAKSLNNKHLQASVYQLLAHYESSLGNGNLAINFTNKSINLFKEIDAKNELIDVYNNITVNYREIKDWNNVIKNAKNSIALIHELDYKKSRLDLLNIYIAEAYISQDSLAKADYFLKKSNNNMIDSTNFTHNYQVLKEKNHLYAKLYKKTGEHKKALIEHENRIENVNKLFKIHDQILKKEIQNKKKLKRKIDANKNLKIKNQKKFLIMNFGVLIIIISFLLRILYLSKMKKKNYKKTKILNTKLIEAQKNLRLKNIEIKELLDLNERTLFSKILKISTYNDTLITIKNNISSLVEKNNIKSNDLFNLENKLIEITNDDDVWKDFQIQFEKIKPDFFKKLNEISNKLTVNDLKNCAYIASKLTNKDVANLINISPRSVETTRYRIKKKLHINKETSLYDFLQKL